MEALSKSEARNIYLTKRKTLDAINEENLNQKIHDLLFSRLMMHRFSPIHIFLPIKNQHEVNTLNIIKTLRKDFAPDIYISRCLDDGTLVHQLFDHNIILRENKWGIPEPKAQISELSSQAFFEKYKDIMIIVPLVIFDKNGHRVGYGKGYYDRFLECASENCTKVGLSFFEAIDLISDSVETDIKLNYCITPSKVWSWI